MVRIIEQVAEALVYMGILCPRPPPPPPPGEKKRLVLAFSMAIIIAYCSSLSFSI